MSALVKKKKLCHNLFKIHLFHTKYTSKSINIYWHITYKIIIKLYLEFFSIAQCTFLNIMPKMCFKITINKIVWISV